ncbi:MAG: GNAT family N-acetyltransferase [Bacteroidetes bacterium]|nr:GNAT family N-acetyltransferase [Bacteroidota bacterium]MBL7105562.1 GNAT family N-acetyltransferase [Bacteroidales bacterium]
MKIEIYNSIDIISTLERKEIIDFLFKHLDEFGDKWEDIERAIEYALSPNPAFGGFVLCVRENGGIIGSVVMNQTRMKGYIPENVLVYIAVHKEYRGKEIGKTLMENAIKISKGNIALHVEPDNPVIHLYNKVGFVNPYLEMRYYKKKPR